MLNHYYTFDYTQFLISLEILYSLQRTNGSRQDCICANHNLFGIEYIQFHKCSTLNLLIYYTIN